jgi:outer membrane receptor protein involved in Fe transport
MSKTIRSKGRLGLKAALGVSVGLTALTVFGAPALAQDSDDGEDTRKLQTVTITATKREQTLQDVPVAVSVVDSAVIEKAQIIDLNDLQSVVPSLKIGQLQSSANTNFIIRGFGNGANNVGIEPSVGVFIDGVYRSRSAAQISDLPNIQRVEVLRGPQSTLFGKNASAGVISVVTQEAQFDWAGSVEGTYGNFNTVRLKGDITGPISETLAFGLAASYNTRDGYAEDIARNADTNERNRYGVRGELKFEPSENMGFRLIGDYDKIDEVCCVAANLINGPTGAITNALGGINPEDPFSYEVFGNRDSENEITNSGISLQGDFEMAFATLTSITAFRNVESFTNQDSDFTGADLIGTNPADSNIDTFTQELRLTSNNADGMFDWMIGAFYFDETVDVEASLTYGADYRAYADALSGGALGAVENAIAGPAAVGNLFGQEGQGRFAEFGQDNTAYSIFGTLDFYATDRLTATIGLNYTNDEKDAFYNQVSTDTFSALDLVALGVGAGVPPQVAADPAFNPFLGLQALQFIPPFVGYPNAVEDGNSEDSDTTYTVRLAYELDDNLNLYGSYATGFKATSWNLSTDSRPFAADFIAGSPASVPAPPPSPIRDAGLATPNLISGTRFAGPEESSVYEIGVKGSYDTFAFNLAFFDQTIRGFQSNAFTGTGFALANAGKQSVRGLEVDATAQLTENFSVAFAGTFLDPVYDSFTGAASGDLSGQQPSGIPETSTSLSGLYENTLTNGWDIFARADWQYESDNDFFDDPAAEALVRSGNWTREQNLVNASLGFTTDTGLGVNLWGRNIFDEQFITTAFPSVAQAGSVSGYPSQPATYGITLKKDW